MHAFLRKLSLHEKRFFEWLKTAISSTACGTSTLKSPLLRAFSVPDVHPRLRKRPPRCTLDCGFETSESPALRGFVGGLRALATAALYLVLKSNGLRHPKNLPVKFGFSSKPIPANSTQKLPSQRCFKPLLIPFFNFSHTLGFRRKIAHSGSHAETGAFQTRVVSLPSDRSARSRIFPGRVSERQTLPLLGLDPVYSRRTQRACGTAMRMMRVVVPRRRGPAGLRSPVAIFIFG